MPNARRSYNWDNATVEGSSCPIVALPACVPPPPAWSGGDRLLLATRVEHTAVALRSLARDHDMPLHRLTRGLFELRGENLGAFVDAAADTLSSVEADEVHVLAAGSDLDGADLLAVAMTSPSLRVAKARADHADLLPLFADEDTAFHAVYQPIVDLSAGTVVGHEALLRATHPEAGAPILPAALFGAAHAAGWTHVLDRVGRTTALRLARSWLGDDLLFINFVPSSIYRPEVCLKTTERAADEAGLRLDQLVFEVTEGHLVRDVEHLTRVFDYYRSRGCRVALDDLGAGYSSLNLLVSLQPDIVKLDREVVQALPGPVATSVVSAVVDICHAYGGLVLAECVETQDQAEAARALGVDLGQGWHFGRPVRRAAQRSLPEQARTIDPALPDAAVALSPDPAAASPR